MSSKYFLLLIAIFAGSCGVKTRPKAPAGTNLPSIQEKYIYKTKTVVMEKDKKKSKEKKEVPKK